MLLLGHLDHLAWDWAHWLCTSPNELLTPLEKVSRQILVWFHVSLAQRSGRGL